MSWKTPYNGPHDRYFNSDDRESWHKNGDEWRREPNIGESWTSTSWRNNVEMHRYHGDPSLAPIQPSTRHYEIEERPRFYGQNSDYHRHYEEPKGWQREERHRGYERRDEWRRSVDKDRREERSDRRRERVDQRRERDDRKSERDDRRHERDDRKNEKEEEKHSETAEEKKHSETAEENVPENTETTAEPSTVDEAEQAEIPQQQEAPDEDNDSEGIKSAADLVILKPNFDDVHFYGVNRGRGGGIRGVGLPRGRGGYRGSFPRAAIDERSPSLVSQYFDRVQKSKTLLPPPSQRLPPPGPSTSHFYPDYFPRGGPPRTHDIPNFGGGMREIPKAKADFLDSSASRRMKEWERFKSENGDDPHQFIETLSDVDEKEAWYQILDLVGGPTVDDDRKMPTMPPMQALETPKRGLLGAHPARGSLHTPSPDRPSFFRNDFPSVRPGLYTGKDEAMAAMGVSRLAPSSASAPPRRGLLGQGPGKSNSTRNYERGRSSFNPYTDSLPERYGGERSLNGPIQSEGSAYEPNLPSQLELLERNSLLEAQLRALKAMQQEQEMKSGHIPSPHQFDGSNAANFDRGYSPDRPPSH